MWNKSRSPNQYMYDENNAILFDEDGNSLTNEDMKVQPRPDPDERELMDSTITIMDDTQTRMDTPN